MRLIFHSGPWAGREVVTAARLLRIGSDPAKNDLVLPDRHLADAHCIVQRSSRGEYILEDLSQMGQSLQINGQLPPPHEMALYLAPGDRFEVGSSEIEVAEAKPRLVQTLGKHAGREIPLSDELLSFGRAPDNVIDLDDSECSIYHAVIRCTAGGFSLEDQRSTNGTFVNGSRVPSHILNDGDVVTIGQQEFLFIADEVQPQIEDQGPGSRRIDEIRAFFLILAGPHSQEHIELGAYPLVIGNAPDCDFVLTDPGAAANQCRIIPTDDSYLIEDLGSGQKTLINGQPLTSGQQMLQPGDLLSIGSTVAEYRLVGGIVSSTGMSMMMTSVIAQGAEQVAPQVKYVVNGHVEVCEFLTIGSSPTCHVMLDGEGIESLHCRIQWSGSFFLEDCSAEGTYLNDRRVIRAPLYGEQVLRVGNEVLDISVHGERCTVDRIDRVQAAAAIQVAQETAFDLSQAQLDPGNIGGAITSAYKTVYKLNVADVDSLVQERKEKFKEGAPTWRPSTDIQRGPGVAFGVVFTLIASVALTFYAYADGDAKDALVNHPLSASHSSKAFAAQAKELGMPDDCRACHASGTDTTLPQCITCHQGFDDLLRAEHVAVNADIPESRTLPGRTCNHCHSEHKGTPRFLQGAPSVLGASRKCTNDSCHPNQHADDIAGTLKSDKFFDAGPVPSFDLPIEEFHVAHATIEVEGKTTAIECTTCHATTDATTGELVEADPGRSCFGCHTPEGGGSIQRECLSCHGQEHGTAHGFVRLSKDDPRAAPVAGTFGTDRSLFIALLALGALFMPAVVLAFLMRLRSRARANRVVSKLKEIPVETIKHLVHSINMEKCVGCHACVQNCPTSVLELVNHKSQIVNFDACIQCRACEASCAFGALVMHDADKDAPSIKTPDLDNGMQTPVPGLYLIGQAAGIPQVKNATNMGRTVVEKALQKGLQAGEARRVGAEVDVLIVGSGPAGLSAALSCHQHGISTLILEKQPEFAWTIRNYFHKGKEVMAEPNEVDCVGHLPIWDTHREELLDRWGQIIEQAQLRIEYRQNVTDIKKVGEMFQIVVSDANDTPVRTITAARVIIAVGGLGNPRKLGCPGDDLDKVRNALVDPDDFRGKEILVVGGTDSAIEVALALCENNKVYFSCRGEHFDRAKPKNRERIGECFKNGKVVPYFVTGVDKVSDNSVVLSNLKDNTAFELPNDYVFALIGGIPPNKWLESLGVRYVSKPHSWSPPPTDQLFKQQ